MSSTKTAYVLCGLTALVVLLWAFHSTAFSFDTRWNTRHEAYSHGYFLLLICLALILRQVPELRQTTRQPYWPAVIPLAALSMLWLFGAVTHVLALQQLALPAIIWCLLTALFGLETGKRLRFPFLLFYAAVPIWDVFNTPLQLLTVKVCTWGLELVGIPAFIEETQITIPGGTFKVAGGCSGLNYLLMIGTVAAVYAHLYYRQFWHKFLLLGFAVAFGLLSNWIRVFSLVIVGHVSDMQSPMLGDHETLGWIAFTACLVPFFYVATLIEARDKILKPVPASPQPELPIRKAWFAFIAATLLVSLSGPLWFASANIHTQARDFDKALSSQSALFSYRKSPAWEPQFRNADGHLILQLPGNSAIQVHIVSYDSQDQGKELIQWGNNLTDGLEWQTSKINSMEGIPINKASIKSTITRAEVIYWYAVGVYFTNSPLKAKWYQFLSFLQGRQDAALLAIFYPCPGDYCSSTRDKAIAQIPQVNRLYESADTL